MWIICSFLKIESFCFAVGYNLVTILAVCSAYQTVTDKSHQNEELASGRGSGDYKFGCVEVTVITGDITKQDCDCIVNSSNDSLDLNRGAVSQAILKKGGKHLAKEIQSLQSKMKKDHIVMTSAPGLNCKKIIHIVATEAKDEWKTIAYRCLQEAENYKMESIAFPALGTGIQMEPSFIANAMLEAIVDFEKSKPKYLRTVRFVIFNTSMTQDFHLALQRHASKGRKDTSGRKTSQNYSQPPKRKKIDPNSVTFIILALSDEIIAKAIQKLESYIDKEIHKKVFDDSIIRKMDDNQLMEIRAIAQQHNLELQMKSDSGSFLILGMASNVMAASDKIHGIMRDAATLEQQKNSAVLLSSLVQWYYIEITEVGQDLVKYQNDLNYKIETAYRSQAANVKFVADFVSFVLDFNKMEEYEEDNTDNVVTVIRRDLVKESSFEAPPTWGQMTGNLRVVVLQASDQEYQDISQKFISSAGQPYTVTKIERIQNKTLWAQYQAKKKQLDDQNPPNTRNENFLWHGTAAEAVDNINFHGFNRSYCGKNATFYGDGVYFAVNANYSCSNTYARPDATGVKRVYYCRVLTGVFCQGKQGMRVPPAKTAGSSALYDSVVDNPNGPGMYIIFHDTQAYPEYLVSFR